MEDLVLTEEERNLILNRRRLMTERKERGVQPARVADKPQPKQEARKTPQVGTGLCDPCKVHKGRLTEGHPMYWFEKNVFQKISNMSHQAEHKKISGLLKMPVQTYSKDRVYHALCHLDVIWTEGNLPVAFKHRYEEYKEKHGIGDDNIHPAHKIKGVKYPVAQNKKPWNPEDYQDYDKNEIFKGDR